MADTKASTSPTPLPPLCPTGLEVAIPDIFDLTTDDDSEAVSLLVKEDVHAKISSLFEAINELRKSVEASPSGELQASLCY